MTVIHNKGITLIGMPGAGKSTIGKILAERLGFKFIDLDVFIKEKEGKSHAEIAKKRGDDALVKIEETYTLGLDFDKVVFSPGGSIVYSPLAMEKVASQTTIFYLALPLETIRKRLGNGVETRGVVGFERLGLKGVFDEREPLYLSYANNVIQCRGLSDAEIVQKINEILQHK